MQNRVYGVSCSFFIFFNFFLPRPRRAHNRGREFMIYSKSLPSLPLLRPRPRAAGSLDDGGPVWLRPLLRSHGMSRYSFNVPADRRKNCIRLRIISEREYFANGARSASHHLRKASSCAQDATTAVRNRSRRRADGRRERICSRIRAARARGRRGRVQRR